MVGKVTVGRLKIDQEFKKHMKLRALELNLVGQAVSDASKESANIGFRIYSLHK